MKVSFRWVAQSGVLSEVGPLIDWVAGMEQEDLEGQVKVGGMIQIDSMNPPLAQTLREWLWESYPDRLAGKGREESKAHGEFVDVAILFMDGYL